MSEEHTSRQEDLAEKWLNGTITPEEADEYARWYNAGQDQPVEIPAAFAANEQEQRNRMLFRILGREKQATVLPLYSRIPLWSAVAVLIVLCAVGGFLFFQQQKQKPVVARSPLKDIVPGHDGAILTLSNGNTVILDSASNGVLARENNVQVIKQNGQLVYQSGKGNSGNNTLNTLSTTRGRQYKLVLPDGTRVWLNAASSITYPTAFTGNTRKVSITGEAYFEVTKNPVHPFIVTANDATITVLGTHFNVMAYADENTLNTTLLEGSVKVTHGAENRLIQPGQQARINQGGQMQVQEVDVNETIAWTTGKLSLENTNVETLMKQISRWYDVDVEYRGAIPHGRFGGVINRNVNLSDLLEILASNGVNCTMEGNKIVVSAK